MDSLLHLRGTPAANWNLLLQVAMGAALLIGVWLARRRQFGWHRACQTTVVLLEVVLIAWVMGPSFHDQGVLSHALAHPRNTYFMVALVHAVFGTAGAGLGLYVVLSAGTPLLPARLRLRNFKLWMRTTLAIWLVALGLGLATFRVWYPPETPARAVTLPAAGAPSPARPAANGEETFQSEPPVSGQRLAHRRDRPGTGEVHGGVHGRQVMAGTVAVVPR